MNIIVFGATGKTGIEVVKQSLAQNHHVTAFVRNPDKLTIEHDNLTVVVGDVLDSATVSPAVINQDAVICALGVGNTLGETTLLSEGTHNIITGMQAADVSRLIVVSAMGVGESWDQLGVMAKFFFKVVLKHVVADHARQEALVHASSLAYTIVRPSGLTDGAKTGSYIFGTESSIKAGRIPRADVADFILKQVDNDAFLGQAVSVT